MDAANFQCPCCNNPWNVAHQDSSQSTDKSGASAVASMSGGFSVCGTCMESDEGTGIDAANFDYTIRPQDDFYLYSNGGWKEANPCPDAYPRFGVFNVLNDLNQKRLKEILGDLESGNVPEAKAPELKGDCIKLCDFYNAAMNEKQIEEDDIQPLMPLLNIAQSINCTNATQVISQLHKHGINVLFNMISGNDKDDAGHTLAVFSQSGLGLPDRDYYFDADKDDKRLKYQRYIEDMFILSASQDEHSISNSNKGNSQHASAALSAYGAPHNARKAAQQVYDFECSLASAFYTKTEMRDVDRYDI